MVTVMERLITPAEDRAQKFTKGKGMYDFWEAPSVRPWDDAEKEFLRTYQLGKMGVFGIEGSGKGVLLTWLAMRFKRFWPTRPLVTDFYLTDEFNQDFSTEIVTSDGEVIDRELAEAQGIEGKLVPAYTYIDQEIMLNQIEQTEVMAKKIGGVLTAEDRQDWVVDGKAGGIALRGAILLLDEFDTWLNKFRMGNKVTEMVMGLYRRYRHYKMLIVGACPTEEDLNPMSLNALMYKVYCSPDDYRPDFFNYAFYIRHGMGSAGIWKVSRTEMLTIYGRPVYKYFWSDAPVSVISHNLPKKKKKVALVSEGT